MTWATFRELFEAEYVSARRRNTRESYRIMLDLFERLCKPTSLRAITERTVSHFAYSLRRERGRAKDSMGQAPATILQRLNLLKAALGWAVEQKLLPELPAFPYVKVPKKKPQPIPLESFERLLAKAPDANMKAYLLAGWLGGLRLSEAAALEWEETDNAPYLDLLHQRIVFPAQVVKAVEDQWIPLDPVLREALEQLPHHGKKVFQLVTSDGQPLALPTLSNRVSRLAKKAGVKLTMHSLRKGFGCRYAGQVPAQVLQKLMRHSNINLTMGYYANVDQAMMDAVLNFSSRVVSRVSEQQAQPTGQDSSTQTVPEKDV
jgi:integrase